MPTVRRIRPASTGVFTKVSAGVDCFVTDRVLDQSQVRSAAPGANVGGPLGCSASRRSHPIRRGDAPQTVDRRGRLSQGSHLLRAWIEGTKTTMDTAAEFGSTFGCGYCRDPRNRRSGKITEVSRFAGTGTILLRCPQCSAHYVVNDDRTTTTRITDSEAESLLKQVGTSDP